MRLLLATAAIPAFLLTGALACDFNHEAKTQATVTVADTRVPQVPADGCAGSNCAEPQPPLQLTDPGGGGGSGQKLDQPPADQTAVAAPSKPSVFGLMTADCASGNCK